MLSMSGHIHNRQRRARERRVLRACESPVSIEHHVTWQVMVAYRIAERRANVHRLYTLPRTLHRPRDRQTMKARLLRYVNKSALKSIAVLSA